MHLINVVTSSSRYDAE